MARGTQAHELSAIKAKILQISLNRLNVGGAPIFPKQSKNQQRVNKGREFIVPLRFIILREWAWL